MYAKHSGEPPPAGHAALIAAIASRQDRGAFAALFTYFAPRVKAYLRRAGLDAGRAEELAQEALLIVWRKAPLYDPSRAAPAAWIFTIARNLRIDALRRDALAYRPSADPAGDFLPEQGADALLLADEQASRLHAALRNLPPDQARLLHAAFFQDRSHSEICADLGIPLGTVKSRLRLAMEKLRAVLKASR